MSRYRIQILVAGLLLLIGAVGYMALVPGVCVTVRNTGQETMRDFAVHVTGRSYSLGDLPPGSSRTQGVSPTSESHVEVEFTDEQGRRIRLDAGGYFEPGYRDQIDIEMRDGKISAVKDEVRISIY